MNTPMNPTPMDPAPAGPALPGPDAARTSYRTWGMVLVLTVIYTYGFIDRAVLALLVEPIKADLKLTDVQMSLLIGFAFVASYTVVGIPAGHLVDRFSRRKTLGFSMVGWSLMTVSCGLAQNFVQLFLARASVGVAEATISPVAFSLIREEVAPAERGRAFSLYGMAPFVGGSLSLLIGAALLAAAGQGAFAAVPWVGGLRPWQQVIVLLGGVGIPLSLLVFLLPERRRSRPQAASEQAGIGFRAAAQHMWAHRTAYGLLIGYVTCCGILAFGKGAWIPAMVSRQWGLTPSQAGYTIGTINIVFGPAGLLLGGFAMARLAKAGKDIRRYGVFAVVMASAASCALPMMPTLNGAWVANAVSVAFTGVFYAVGAATLSQLTPQRMMGKVTAAYLLLQGTLAQGFGPFFVAALADTLFKAHGRLALGHAMSLAAAVVGTTALCLLLLLMRRLTGQAEVA